jgi:hypothetical protein
MVRFVKWMHIPILVVVFNDGKAGFDESSAIPSWGGQLPI